MRKSSKARLFSSCLTGAILAAAAPAWAQTSEAPTWKPRAEVDAQVGENIGISTSLFAPVAQNDSGLIYVDGRIGYDQRFDRNGSATVGARFRAGEDFAIGVNAGADFYRSDIGKRDQAAVSLGLEGFSSVFDVRLNYRLPLSKIETIGYIDPAAAPSGTGALVLENNRLFERYSGFRLEAIPLEGFNAEAGVRLPVGSNASIRGSAAGFDYSDSRADDNYRGYRVGLEMDVEDKGSGARFTFGGTLEHTERYGTDARATVRLSVPFGGRASDRGAVPTGLDRQMGDRVRRDYVARSGSRYTDLTSSRFAIDARTGNPFGGFYYASGTGATGSAGTLAAPTTLGDAVTRAGANGVVVALGSGGNISTTGVTLAANQYLVGGASAVDVRLINGSTVAYGLGGTNGVIVGTAAGTPSVTLGQGSVVRDVTVRGAGVGIAANGVGGFALDRVVIENTGGAGLSLTNTLGSVALTGLTVRGGAGAGVLVNGGNSISLANSTISGGAGAVDINDGGANVAVSLSNLTLSATGGNVLDIDGSGAGTVTVTGMSGITVRGGTGETGGVSVRSATFDANTTTAGIQTVNAGRMEVGTTAARVNGQGVFLTDVTGSLSFADLDIANSGATGLRVANPKANNFTLATLDGTIDTVGGTAADLDPLTTDLTFAGMSSVGAAGPGVILDTVQGGGTGGNALTIGTLTVSNSGAEALVLLNSTGLVRVNGGTVSNSGGSAVRIGTAGVAGSGGSVNLVFGAAITDTAGAAPIVALFNASGTISFTGPITGTGTGGIQIENLLAGSSVNFGAISLANTTGTAISLNNLAGAVRFNGLVTIANPTANGIVIGNVPGGVTFGDVDITGLGDFTGLDVRATQGTVLFNTLDISGTGVGTGIDATGSTNSGNVIVLTGSVIQNVDIGVDLTNAAMTGQFRFGDGDGGTMSSRITANTPIVIAGMNTSQGSYNFADVMLQGDITNITGMGFTAYYAQVGATGAGTRDDPGSLAGAEASGAQYIVLLNDGIGAQDVFDAATAGGSFDLAVGQALISFLNQDFFAVSGASVPANLVLTGVGPAGITNPYAGSGGAVLTSSLAGSATVNLATNSSIDGLVIRNAAGDVGVEGSGVSGVRILNSDISGAAGAIAISDGGAASSVQLTNLDLASNSGVALSLSGAGAGTLSVSASNVDIAATGSSAALSIADVESAGISFGSVTAGTSATGAVSIENVSGGSVAIGSIAVAGTAASEGVSIEGASSTIVIQSINVAGTAEDAVRLVDNSGAIAIGTISAGTAGVSGDGVQLTRNGAVSIGALVVNGANAGLAIEDSLGNVTIGDAAISGVGSGVIIDGVGAGSAVSIGDLSINGTSAAGISLSRVEGGVTFTGTTDIAGIGTSGIVLGAGSTGTIGFGDVNITGLAAGTTGVTARAASGTITFNTLDITGTSTSGTRGIDLTGATFATNFTVAESSSITGVGVGVDLTNTAITGAFRYGDGSNTDADGAASTIAAVVPLEITGLNAGVGSYNFADVNLNGDISQLVTSASVYYVLAGAAGAGTLSDPGTLAGAEASGAQFIVLLNDAAGGQDVLDVVSAGGSFDIAAGQSLLGFLNGDTLTLPGGSPANLILFGITPGQVVNPFAGSGAPVITNSAAGNGITLASNTLVDGIRVDIPSGVGITATGSANVTIRNSVIAGGAGAIVLADGGATASAGLRNLQLSAGSGAVLNFNGSGFGTLTITALDAVTIAGGNGEAFGILGDGMIFDADPTAAGFQTVSGTLQAGTGAARIGGTGIYLQNAQGDASFGLDIASDGGSGLYVAGGIGGLRFATSGGTIDAINAGGGFGLLLRDLASSVALDTISVAGGTGVSTQNVAGAGAAGNALTVDSLIVADGSAGAIAMSGSASGSFVFGTGSSIGTTTGSAITLSNSGASSLVYNGDVNFAGANAVLSVSGGHNGAVTFTGGAIAATSGTGLVFDNADGSYDFSSTANLAAGISIANGSAGTFAFSNIAIANPAGSALDVRDSTASVSYSGAITAASAVAPAVYIANHSVGTIAFDTGSLDASGGNGLTFVNADGRYIFTNIIDIDTNITGISIAGGSSGTFTFGAAASVATTGGAAITISDSSANLDYRGSARASGGTGISVINHSVGTLDLSAAALDLNGGTTIRFDNADGTYLFGNFATTGGSGIAILNGSAGSFTFGDVDIDGTAAGQTAVNLIGATGNVTFNTLDITGVSTTNSRGINLSGNTGAGNIVVTNSSAISGVGIGIDLTNANRTGLFQFGDGERSIDVASSINATTPLVITGLNGGAGTYNFADVNLTGDTSNLATSATVFYVLAGATGAGTLGDPGSLAAAEAATADFIILLNDPHGGQDVIDALGTNADNTLVLDANQALRSFRDGNIILLPGGAPANVILTGVATGQVANPFGAPGDTASDRAPILTTTGAAHTVTLSNGSSVAGVFVQSVANQAALYGIGRSGVSISNATLSGVGRGLLLEGGGTASASLTNLDVTALGGGVWLNPFSTGSLTVTGSGIDVSSSGTGSLLIVRSTTIGAAGLSLGTLTGTGTDTNVVLNGALGGGLVSIGTINVGGTGAGPGVLLQGNSAEIDIGSVTISGQTGAGVTFASGGLVHIDSLDVTGGTRGISIVNALNGIYSIDNLTVTGADYGIFQALGFTGSLTIGTATITGADTGMAFSAMNGTTTFTGAVSIANPAVAGISFANNSGAFTFDDVDITGLQANGRGVDARTMGGGNIYFETLDITGASATGTRGIDLTGNNGGGAFIVNQSSAITGVGVGVDLTNASRVTSFRYGDGSNVDFDLAASSINATIPIVITGLNGSTGNYDFLDVTLTGDTSGLEADAFFVQAGASGVGSATSPGSLAAAQASGAAFIVLLDSQAGAGAFDTITGPFTLADGQTLLAFRNVDTFNVASGAPANVKLFNITTGTIENPFAGSGAPLLTSTDGTGTIQLGGTATIDGVVVSNTGTGAGIYANGTAGTATIRNSTISGGGAGIDIRSGAATRVVNLQNLTLRNAGNNPGALLTLNGTGGLLTVTGMSNFAIDTSGGETAGLLFNTVTFDSDLATAGIQAVNAGAFTVGTNGARVQGDGVSLVNVSGALTFTDIDIANNGGTGLRVANSKANNFLLTTLDGSVDTTNGTAVDLDPLVVNMTLAGVTASGGTYGILLDQVEGDFTVTGAVDVTGATTGGIVVRNNTGQSDALAANFNGAVSINNTSGAGLSLTNNGGATINFAGGGAGVDIVTTSGAGLVATGGGTISFAGSSNTIQTATGQIADFTGVSAAAGGIAFASMASTGVVSGVTAVNLNNLDGGAFNGGTVSVAGTSGATSDGIFIGGGSSSAISFAATTIAATGGEGVEINGTGNGAISFSNLTIDNTAGDGVLITGSNGDVTISAGAIGATDDPTGVGFNVSGGAGGIIAIGASIGKTTAGRTVQVTGRSSGSVTFSGDIAASGAASGLYVANNSGSANVTFSGASKSINVAGVTGVDLVNNSGAFVAFTNGGLEITSTATGLSAVGGGTIGIAGTGNTISSGGGNPLALSGVDILASGIGFDSITTTATVGGIAFSGLGGGAITLGTVNLQGVTSRGIDIGGSFGTALTITDLDIGLASASAVAFDLNGAALAASIAVGDFDVTSSAAPGTSIGVDLRGVTGGQSVRLGSAAPGGAASTVSGVGTGIYLDAATNAGFTFGDGDAGAGASTISAVTAINASAAPGAGSYDFRDVTFTASPGLGFGVGRTLFVDSNGATGGGNGSGADGGNPMTLAAAELALAATDVIVLINNGAAISTAGTNGNDTLALLANTQVRGFGQGPLALTLTVPSTILLSSNTINIADPTGNGAATLTSAAGADIITLGASGNRISGFILDGAPGGALRGIVDNGGATGAVVNFMTVRNFNAVGGYGIEITPSTNSTIDNVSLTGNTNDIFLNAAGSTISNVTATGATGTSITLNNATGATTLTNVNVSGAATGLSFTTPAGTINATNVDISGAATSALTVSGGTASFNFDAASSIVQAAAGIAVNFTGNHTTGTFAYAGLINATNGSGLQFDNADGTYNFTGTTTLNGGDAGIDIVNGATGNFTFGSGTSITHNNAGNAFSLLSNANITYDGTITDNNGAAVAIDGHDAGTVTFNGAISSSIANGSTVVSIANSNAGSIAFNGQMNIASTGTVVSLSDNDGSTITFNAGGTGLDITGTTNAGMVITGGGTVNVLGSGNSIATTSGTLLSITNPGATTTTANLAFASATNTSGTNGIFVQRNGGTLGGTVNIAGGAITATTRGVALAGDALAFTYGGTITTSGAAARSVEATGRTAGTATLSGNINESSLGINIANNSGGTVSFTGQSISVNTTAGTGNGVTLLNNGGSAVNFASAGGGNGLDIVTSSGIGLSASGGGTLTISGSGNSIQTATGQILSLTNVNTATAGISFGSLQSTGTVTGIAVNFSNFDTSGGGGFSGGTTTIAATTGGDGIFIGNGSSANINFGATTIGTTADTIGGDGIEVNGTGNGSVTFASVDIDGTAAHGVNIAGSAGATGAVSINGGTIGATANTTGDGVNVTGGGTNFTIAAAITKTNAGNVVEVSNRAAGTVTFSGNLSATGGFANGILLNNNSFGTITFSGASKVISTGANNAIQVDNNNFTGAAVSFTGGGLVVNTGAGRGITATSTQAGAGSLAITGTGNSITSAGGIALNMVNTNIAGGGLNFQSVSANGGTRGIVLNNTGGSAGLTVTGTGTTDGSGGTIQNITQRGIELLNTAQVSIANLNLTNASTTGQAAGSDTDLTTANGAIYLSNVNTAVFNNVDITGTIADNGITGTNVSNFQFNNGLIDNAGDGINESGIEFINLSGTSSLTNSEIRFSETNSLDIYNTDVNLDLTLDNVIFRDTQSSATNGEGGLQFRSFSTAAGSPVTNIDIIDSDFLRLRTQAIQAIAEDDSILNIDITNNVIDVGTGIGSGIDINGNDTATVNFNVNGNPTIRTSGGAAVNISSFLGATVMGRINNNANIEVFSQSGTSNASGSGVRLLAQESSRLIAEVSGNAINQGAFNNSASVDVVAREGSARVDLRLINNVIDSTDTGTLADINMQSGSSSGTNTETNQIYAYIANNNLTAAASPVVLRLRVSELDNTNDPRIFLQGFVEGGSGLDDDAVATWNANGNTPGANTANITVSLSGTATAPSAGNAVAPSNPVP